MSREGKFDSTTDHQASIWLLSGTLLLALISFSYISPENTRVKFVYSGRLLSNISFCLPLETAPCLSSMEPPPPIHFMWLGMERPHLLALGGGHMTQVWPTGHSILLAIGKRATNRQAQDPGQAMRLNSGTLAGTIEKGVNCFYLGC